SMNFAKPAMSSKPDQMSSRSRIRQLKLNSTNEPCPEVEIDRWLSTGVRCWRPNWCICRRHDSAKLFFCGEPSRRRSATYARTIEGRTESDPRTGGKNFTGDRQDGGTVGTDSKGDRSSSTGNIW